MPLIPTELIVPRKGRKSFRMNDFYYDTNKQSQVMRVIEFLSMFVKEYPELLWDRPNNKAPWHWKTDLHAMNATLNVFPHKASWYIQLKDATGTVYKGVGWDELLNTVAELSVTKEDASE